MSENGNMKRMKDPLLSDPHSRADDLLVCFGFLNIVNILVVDYRVFECFFNINSCLATIHFISQHHAIHCYR